MSVLITLGLAVMTCAYAGLLSGRLAGYRASGLLSVSSILGAAHCVREHQAFNACLFAVQAAALAWAWWNGGGDDDFRRGRRRLRRLLTSARRTASAV
ncbi:hypothetical protein ACFC0S_16190 [Streptomyces sp. NPDC056084]|uniref:hypothetical protein n=1 Tax=unclassified Streptomyces TaxID=2593676 RepID=UPI0035E2E9A6